MWSETLAHLLLIVGFLSLHRVVRDPCSYLHAWFWDFLPGLNLPAFLGLQVLVKDAAGVAPLLHHFVVVLFRDVDCLLYQAPAFGANHRLDRLHTSVSSAWAIGSADSYFQSTFNAGHVMNIINIVCVSTSRGVCARVAETLN